VGKIEGGKESSGARRQKTSAKGTGERRLICSEQKKRARSCPRSLFVDVISGPPRARPVQQVGLFREWLCALLRGHSVKGGPALFDVMAAALWAGDLLLLMFGNGQYFGKYFFASAALEFVDRHGDLLALRWALYRF
jgi:hypothetical protein